ASSNSVAFLAPPGADLAIKFGMYRTAGISGDAAGAGIVLSWFFTTGYKLVVPIIALTWVMIAEGFKDPTFTTLTIIGLAAVLGGVGITALILYRERVASRIGATTQRWYNGLAGGRWKFPKAKGFDVKLVDFRSQVIGTVRAKWFPALVATLGAQAIFFLMLVLSMRFMGVTEELAPTSIIFDAYAVGLLLSMIPIFPGGVGVVELAYVAVIVGTTQNEPLANAVTAGAFAHRIFSWLIPILIGLIPLAAWRRQMVKDQADTGPPAPTTG
ncbi:MAG: lysylphosphatidylglycerol synthase domain-containing protein, partial [Acidimicrobiia bacterium]